MSVNDQQNVVTDPENESVTTATETGTIGTDGTGTVTGTTGTVAPAGVKFADVYGSGVSSKKLSLKDWSEREGYDIEGDFKNAAADLEYEYKTHLSNYGANAEKLYQMGLSNAGVSDIYGANAYSAYLSAMNDLNLAKIEQQRELKRLYSQYATDYDDTINADATGAYNYILSNNLWNGANADVVKDLLLNQGYGEEAVYEAMRRLDAVDPSWLQNQRVMAAYNSVQQSYLGTESAEHVKSLLSAAGYTADEINAAMTLLESGYKARKTAADKETFEANKPLAVNYALQNYNGNNKQTVLDYIKATYGEEMVAHVESMLGGLSDETLAYLSDKTVLSAVETYSSQYVGEESEDSIREKMRMNGMTDAQIDAAMDIIKSDYNASPEVIEAKEQEKINNMVSKYREMYTSTVFDSTVSKLMTEEGLDEAIARKIAKKLDESFKENVAAGYFKYKDAYSEGSIDIATIRTELKMLECTDKEIQEIVRKLKLLDGTTQNSTSDQDDVWKAYDFITKNIASMGKNNVIAYLSSQNFSQAIINEAWSKFEGSEVGMEWSEGQTQTTVKGLVTSWTDAKDFDPSVSMDAYISKKGIDTSNKESQEYKNAVAAWEQMRGTYDTNVSKAYGLISGVPASATDEDLKNGISMSGQTFTDAEVAGAIKLFRKLNTWEKDIVNTQVDTELDKVDKNLQTKKTNTGSLTYEDYSNAVSMVDGIEAQYGETDASKKAKEKYRQQNLNIINGYLDGSGDLDEAYDYLGSAKLGGVDESTWNDMNELDKRRAIIDWAKGKVGGGEILPNEFYGMVSKYVTDKVTGTGGIIETDNGNLKASGLADAGDLVTYIKGLGLNKDKQNELIGQVVDEMGFEISCSQINWYGTVEGAEASIYGWKEDKTKKVSNIDLINELDKKVLQSGITAYNGKLYGKNNKNEWFEVPTDGVTIVGDGHTNTAEQAKGIYEILVAMLTPESPESEKTGGGGSTGNIVGKQQITQSMMK